MVYYEVIMEYINKLNKNVKNALGGVSRAISALEETGRQQIVEFGGQKFTLGDDEKTKRFSRVFGKMEALRKEYSGFGDVHNTAHAVAIIENNGQKYVSLLQIIEPKEEETESQKYQRYDDVANEIWNAQLVDFNGKEIPVTVSSNGIDREFKVDNPDELKIEIRDFRHQAKENGLSHIEWVYDNKDKENLSLVYP